jgi:hypothetical protein
LEALVDLYRDRHAFVFGEVALALVEGEEGGGAEVQGGGDVEQVEEAVTLRLCVVGTEAFGDSMDLGPVDGDDLQDVGGEVALQIAGAAAL